MHLFITVVPIKLFHYLRCSQFNRGCCGCKLVCPQGRDVANRLVHCAYCLEWTMRGEADPAWPCADCCTGEVLIV